MRQKNRILLRGFNFEISHIGFNSPAVTGQTEGDLTTPGTKEPVLEEIRIEKPLNNTSSREGGNSTSRDAITKYPIHAGTGIQGCELNLYEWANTEKRLFLAHGENHLSGSSQTQSRYLGSTPNELNTRTEHFDRDDITGDYHVATLVNNLLYREY